MPTVDHVARSSMVAPILCLTFTSTLLGHTPTSTSAPNLQNEASSVVRIALPALCPCKGSPLQNLYEGLRGCHSSHLSPASPSSVSLSRRGSVEAFHISTFATWHIKGVLSAAPWRQFPALQWAPAVVPQARTFCTPPFALGLCCHNYVNLQQWTMRLASSFPRHIVSRLADHPRKGHHLQTHSARFGLSITYEFNEQRPVDLCIFGIYSQPNAAQSNT